MPLIVITGIPCSGKSTVTKAIKEHLETQSKKVRIHLQFTGMRQCWTPGTPGPLSYSAQSDQSLHGIFELIIHSFSVKVQNFRLEGG